MELTSPTALSPVVEQEGGFELTNFEHSQHSHFSRELPVTADGLSGSYQRTQNRVSSRSARANISPNTPPSGLKRGHEDQSYKVISDDKSNIRQTSQPGKPAIVVGEHAEEPHRIFHIENAHTSTASPQAVLGGDVSGIDISQSSEPEIRQYSGRGKGRAIDFDQGHNLCVLDVGQSQSTTLNSAVGHQHEPRLDEDDHVPLLNSTIGTWPFNDPHFERRHYLQKKAQRIRLEALDSCRAIWPERCRIHGEFFKYADTIEQEGYNVRSGDVSMPASVYQTSGTNSSITLCGTMLDDANILEEAGLAAEIRRRDESSLRCVEGWMGITIFVLGMVAIVTFAVENASVVQRGMPTWFPKVAQTWPHSIRGRVFPSRDGHYLVPKKSYKRVVSFSWMSLLA